MKPETTPSLPSSIGRRRLLAGGLLAGAALLLPRGVAAGQLNAAAGDVRVNGGPARRGTAVQPGDIVSTGGHSQAVFVVGGDAFLLRADSDMELYGAGNAAAASGLRLLTGALLAVFGGGARDVLTATATAGIRGTGIYVEATPEQTYFCTCYGEVHLADQHRQQRRLVRSSYHESHIIHAAPQDGRMMAPAAVRNHSDEELVLLESLVGRKPPFRR
jgi:hypothetical protein